MTAATVWKYDLRVEDELLVEMPRGAELLHVGNQSGEIDRFTVWARVTPPPGNANAARRLLVRGTGHPVGDEPYVGTTFGGPLVWHIFDGGEV